MARVLCAMSGGVDSSLAAALLREAGHEVLGIFLRLGEGADGGNGGSLASSRSCCSITDARDAARVAERLGIPFYALNYREQFDRVIDHFVGEYNAGRTPNPCARCNQWIKFGSLVEQARALGCEHIATGHYARVERSDRRGRPALRRGADGDKDQSYFLFTVPRKSLEMTLFPVGGLTKARCRALARELGLPVADKRESQEICFVPGGDYTKVVASRTPDHVRPGALLDPDGAVVGSHPGHQHFTIGQRRGLGKAFGEPRYVVGIDAAANTVTVGPRELLACRAFEMEETNWVSIDPPAAGVAIECAVQVRHRGRAVAARVTVREGNAAHVDLAAPHEAVTPGQAAVLYDRDVVLGGGWIRSRSDSRSDM